MRKNYTYPDHSVAVCVLIIITVLLSLGYSNNKKAIVETMQMQPDVYETVVTITGKEEEGYSCSYVKADGTVVLITESFDIGEYDVGDTYTILLNSKGEPPDIEGFELSKKNKTLQLSKLSSILLAVMLILSIITLILLVITLRNRRVRKRVMDLHDGEFNIEDVDYVVPDKEESIFTQDSSENAVTDEIDSIFDD